MNKTKEADAIPPITGSIESSQQPKIRRRGVVGGHESTSIATLLILIRTRGSGLHNLRQAGSRPTWQLAPKALATVSVATGKAAFRLAVKLPVNLRVFPDALPMRAGVGWQ
jgi:hypothetical protein